MKNNILVSGSHRSGSTWTGKVIAKAKGVRYVHEPFNIRIYRPYSPLKYTFEYLNGSPKSHQEEVRNYINSFSTLYSPYNLKKLVNFNPLRDRKHAFDDFNAVFADRAIIKDPIALMSAEWIDENFDWDIVILIRHPAAFVASLKVKNWQFNFRQYRDQNLLMKDFMMDYSAMIDEYIEHKKDIADQGILLWNIIHDIISYYREKHNNWYFVKHEDLSMNPIAEFEKMFSFLNLEFDNEVKKYIEESTSSEARTELTRNSIRNIKAWKRRLSTKEIERIKTGTKRVWPKFYSESDW